MNVTIPIPDDFAARFGSEAELGRRALQALGLEEHRGGRIVDEPPSLAWSERVLKLMRVHRLTAYDATYLELAQRRALPLATKDRDLLVAAPAVGVPVFTAVP